MAVSYPWAKWSSFYEIGVLDVQAREKWFYQAIGASPGNMHIRVDLLGSNGRLRDHPVQRSGGADVRIKLFDVPPLDATADLRLLEPMRGLLAPAPSGNWADLFEVMLEDADPLVRQAHPHLDGAIITFASSTLAVNGTCILLRSLVADVNGRYRAQTYGSPADAKRRVITRLALAMIADTLNRETTDD